MADTNIGRPVARISKVGVLFGGKVDLNISLRGGAHLGKKCTFAGAYPWEGGGSKGALPPPPTETYTGRPKLKL